MPMIIKTCIVCQTSFTCVQRPKREQVCCGKVCSDQHRSRTFTPSNKGTGQRYIVTCEWCKIQEEVGASKRTRRFCSRRCLQTAHWRNNPERRRRASERALLWVTPEWRKRSSEHAKRINSDPIVRAKISQTLRGKIFCGMRGGNGTLTPEQLILQQKLGWDVEVAIPTGNPKWKAAVVDLAHPTLRIAVECDGASHHTTKQRNRDRMKDQMLESIGWVVLRFWNSRITTDLDSVLAEVRVHEASGSYR